MDRGWMMKMNFIVQAIFHPLLCFFIFRKLPLQFHPILYLCRFHIMTRKQYVFIILILGALSAISPFSIDMYLPAFPAIARDFGTTVAQIQLSLTSYLVGIAGGQLLYGPLVDKYGRKKPLYFGLTVYVIASILCAYTESADALIWLRFLQALGGCAGMVVAGAFVRDLFPVKDSAKVFSLIILVISVSPMIAPTFGSYISVAFGWQSLFLILAGITLLVMAGIFFVLPEGRKGNATLSLKPKTTILNFRAVFLDRQFLTYALVGALGSASIFAYISGSPDVFMNIYSLNEKEYGWIFGFLAFGVIGASQLNYVLLRHFKSEQIIYAALCYQTLCGLILLVVASAGMPNLYILMAIIFIYLTSIGLTSPNTSALAMAPFSENAGSASALLGFIRMSVGAVASAMVSLLHNATIFPMLIVMAASSIISFLLLFIGKRRHLDTAKIQAEL